MLKQEQDDFYNANYPEEKEDNKMTSFLEQLDALKSTENTILNKAVLGNFQQKTECPNLVIRKKQSFIGFCEPPGVALPFEIERQVYGVDWYGYKRSFRDIALAMYSLLFSKEHYLEMTLTHPQSEIKTLYFYFEKEQIETPFLTIENEPTYKSYEYFRGEVERYPSIVEQSEPSLSYAWKQKNYNNEYSKQINQAKELVVSVTTQGICALASLFLDISAVDNKQDEICLESPSLGCGGVAENSLETRFWLPNSFAFYCNNLDDLDF